MKFLSILASLAFFIAGAQAEVTAIDDLFYGHYEEIKPVWNNAGSPGGKRYTVELQSWPRKTSTVLLVKAINATIATACPSGQSCTLLVPFVCVSLNDQELRALGCAMGRARAAGYKTVMPYSPSHRIYNTRIVHSSGYGTGSNTYWTDEADPKFTNSYYGTTIEGTCVAAAKIAGQNDNTGVAMDTINSSPVENCGGTTSELDCYQVLGRQNIDGIFV